MEKKKVEKKPLGPQEIIEASGHNLHTSVVEYLKGDGFVVEISPYYVDAHTDKPREVDAVARKRVPLFVDSAEHAIELVLAIDCKYIKQNTVFWTFNNENHRHALKLRGSNLEQLMDRFREEGFMYFRTSHVARLFQTGGGSDDAISDPIYKACIQAINGSIFAREHSKNPGLVYPIVIVDGPGKFYSAADTAKELESVLVHIDYSYYPNRETSTKPTREPFYVWLVRKEKLSEANKTLEAEAWKNTF
jgi:hypothetical protein